MHAAQACRIVLESGTRVRFCKISIWDFKDLQLDLKLRVLVAIPFTNPLQYINILESSFNFKSSYSANKASFYKAFNAIFGKVGRNASEEVLFAILKSKCLPILLYGTEACPTNSSVRQSLQFTNLQSLM